LSSVGFPHLFVFSFTSTSEERAKIETVHGASQALRHLTESNPISQPFSDSGLSYSGFTYKFL